MSANTEQRKLAAIMFTDMVAKAPNHANSPPDVLDGQAASGSPQKRLSFLN